MLTEECVLAPRNLSVGCALLEQVAVIFPTPRRSSQTVSPTHLLQGKSESLREASCRPTLPPTAAAAALTSRHARTASESFANQSSCSRPSEVRLNIRALQLLHSPRYQQ